ncbi:DEAD/DEAH box helicase family protein [Candidatus Uhrbacteria bacterium]|nr:DEAD/DEAH box helicase family protein [Candidatus Uhrbacteria bacterium]
MTIREKSIGELTGQMKEVSRTIGESIAAPTVSPETFASLSADQLQRLFSRRFEIYRKILLERSTVGDTSVGLSDRELASMREYLRMLNAIDQYIADNPTGVEGEPRLEPFQVDVIRAIQRFIEEGNTRGYLTMAGGTGKTVVYTKLLDVMRPRKTLILSPSQPSIGQIKDKMQVFAEGLDVGQIYQHAKEYGHDITVTTPNSYLLDIAADPEYARQFDCVIFDEAHRYLAPRMRAGIAALREDALMLGFTQTEKYSDEKKVANYLPIRIGNIDISEAVALRAISAFQTIFIKTKVDVSDVTITPDGGLNDREMQELAEQVGLDITMVDTYKEFTPDKRAMAFFNRKTECIEAAALYNNEGVRAAAIYSGMSQTETNAILKAHRAGEIKVVVCMKKLAESYDDPGIEVVLCHRPTLSPVLESQRCTRATRIPSWERDILKHHFSDEQKLPPKVALIIEAIFQSRDPRKVQVTFPSIAGGSFLYPKNSPESTKPRIYLPPVPEQVYTIHGLQVIADHRMVYEMTEKMEKEKYGDPESGWLPLEAILQNPYFEGITSFLITSNVYRLELKHPEWVKLFVNREKNKLLKHFSPDLIAALKNEFPLFPEGWKSEDDEVLKTYRLGRERLKRTASAVSRTLRIPYQDLICSRGKRVAISPQFESLLPDLYTPIPAGANTISQLTQESGGRVSEAAIRDVVEPYRASHQDWFIKQMTKLEKESPYTLRYRPDKSFKGHEYLTRELCDIVREHFDFGEERVRKGRPRPGWRMRTSLESQYGPLPPRVEQVVQNNPDTAELRNFNKTVDRSYHPKIIAEWAKEAERLAKKHAEELRKRYRPAPHGWISLYDFWKETKFETPEILQVKLNRMEDHLTHTAYPLVYFLDASGIPNLHMSPTQVQLARIEFGLINRFSRQTVQPSNWREESRFEDEYGYDSENIDFLAKGTLALANKDTPEEKRTAMERSRNMAPDTDRILWHRALARITKESLSPAKKTLLERCVNPRPEGSRSIFELARELGLYALVYPDDYTKEEEKALFLARDANGIPNQHFPASIVADIKKRFTTRDVTPWGLEGISSTHTERRVTHDERERRYPLPPHGAMTADQLARMLRVNKNNAEYIAYTILNSGIGSRDTYQEEGADKPEQYYSKDICDIARSENPLIPREWIKDNAVINKYGYGADLYDVMDHLARVRKDLCIKHGTKYGLSPEGEMLLQRLIDRIPPGAEKIKHVAMHLNRTLEDVAALAAKYRAGDPDLFFYQRRPAGIQEYAIARLIALMKKWFDSGADKSGKPFSKHTLSDKEKAELKEIMFGPPYDAPREHRFPYGWRDRDSLMREYGKMGEHTQRYVAQHSMSVKILPHPKSKKAVYCYGPDVIYEWEQEAVEKSKSVTAFKDAPSNHLSLFELARNLGRDEITIDELTDSERDLLFTYKDKRGLPVDHLPTWTADKIRERLGVRIVDTI